MSNPVISLRIGASEKERLDELEYVYGIRSEYEAIRRGELETISLDEVERDLLGD
ncbi:peptidylprolyl isomerase [Corynebacterium diphtheriae]